MVAEERHEYSCLWETDNSIICFFFFFKGFCLVGTFEEDAVQVLKGLSLIAMVANLNAEFSVSLLQQLLNRSPTLYFSSEYTMSHQTPTQSWLHCSNAMYIILFHCEVSKPLINITKICNILFVVFCEHKRA